MRTNNRIIAIELTSLDSTSLTVNYQAINPDGLEEACYLLRIINDSGMDVTLSGDGVTDNDFVMAGDTAMVTAPYSSADMPNFKEGSIIYVKSTGAGQSGAVYLAGYART